MHAYFILREANDPKNCLINQCPDSLRSKKWRIPKGQRMDAHYPPDVTLRMDAEQPGLLVPDLIKNTFRFCLVSSKLKALLEQEAGAEIEFLPTAITNHKGRTVLGDFFIANVIGTQDCVDLERSEFDALEDEPDRFNALFRLHLREDRIPSGLKLFRIQPMPGVLVLRDDLRTRLEEQGLTGAQYIPMGASCTIL